MQLYVRIPNWGATVMEGESVESLLAELQAKYTDVAKDIIVRVPTTHKLSDTNTKQYTEKNKSTMSNELLVLPEEKHVLMCALNDRYIYLSRLLDNMKKQPEGTYTFEDFSNINTSHNQVQSLINRVRKLSDEL